MKTIRILTNLVYGGIDPHTLETGCGGSEEKLFEFGREMAKVADVTIYTNGWHGDYEGVHYVGMNQFKAWEYSDIFISFKNKDSLIETINASKILHWTTEIEPEWSKSMLSGVDSIICISDYHKSKMRPSSPKFVASYLWADFERMSGDSFSFAGDMASNGVANINIDTIQKEKGSMLYSSSFDRGLEELLVNWELVKEKLGVKTLYITYGWDFINQLIKTNPHLRQWKFKIEELLKQEGVVILGRLSNDEMCKMYWKCEYWCLPVNNPDSELFCINAVKAQYAGCIPIVRKIGALQETVGECINWDEIVGKPNQKSTWNEKSIQNNLKHVEQFNMQLRIKEWTELLTLKK